MRWSGVVALACLGSSFLHAQAPDVPLTLENSDYWEIHSHLVGSRPVVQTPWSESAHQFYQAPSEFLLEVDAEGSVVGATFQSGPAMQREEAQQVARAMHFKPFEREGHAIPVRLHYEIGTQRADYTGPPDRAFPTKTSALDTTIELERTGCFGSRPGYRVEVRGDGQITFRGRGYVLVNGVHRWRISRSEVARLIEHFRRADYFKLKGYYEVDATDLPTYITHLHIGEQRKFILNYGGSGFGGAVASTSGGGESPQMPPVVTELENAIDQISGASSWVRGDDKTISRLRAAKWSFGSKQGGQALGLLIGDCNIKLARAFIQEGAPVDGKGDAWGASPAIAAVPFCADVGLAQLMASKGALASKANAKAFLQTSVEFGFPDLVRLALKHFGNVRINDRNGQPLLFAAAGAYDHRVDTNEGTDGDAKFNSAMVASMLLSAGADVKARDEEGNTVLHAVNDESVARMLIRAGANVNAQNDAGRTPLFDHYFSDPKKALLEAGADVKVRDRHGQTPLFGQENDVAVGLLIQAGAEVNAVDSEGNTPLESAGSEKAALALLAAGAKPPTDPLRAKALLEQATARKWMALLSTLTAMRSTEVLQ